MLVFLELLYIYIFAFCLLTQSQFLFQTSNQQSFSPEEFNSCFSQLFGPVEVACPSVETLHRFNLESFHPLITQLVKRPYFRYYQVCLVETLSTDWIHIALIITSLVVRVNIIVINLITVITL